MDEGGSISLSAQQPQVDVALTATLTDQDATDAQKGEAKWKWEQSSAMDGPWMVIVGATARAYDPVAGVVDKYLRATATYTDEHGDDKTAMAVSAHAVRAVPAGGNAAPEFSSDTANRTVKENSPPGTNVGKPLTAGDAGDILTYTMADPDPGTPDHDEESFTIDRATGQIMVGPRTMLDTETKSSYEVDVRATDPLGNPDAADAVADNSDTVTVTITIDNVNEAPTMVVGATRSDHMEGDSNPNEDGVQLQPGIIYMATDIEDDLADPQKPREWSVSGADASKFNIPEGVLTFKDAPDFESPADADMDNMYMVTVVATDAKKLTAMRGRGHHRHQRE